MYVLKKKLHANKSWHNINSKVQLARDSLETTRGCRMHAASAATATTTPIAAAIVDGVAIAVPRNSTMQ